MTLNEHIDNFLRDAQYRIGTLSTELDDIRDDGEYEKINELFNKRNMLITFMDILYEGKWYITNGYNHIQYLLDSGSEEGWTEREVIQEIEHLRYYTEMNEVPFITFTAHYPQIVNPTGSGGSGSVTGLPAGLPGQMIFFNAAGQPIADFVELYGGMRNNESINSYFSGRL